MRMIVRHPAFDGLLAGVASQLRAVVIVNALAFG
jgi:hypothetical protein